MKIPKRIIGFLELKGEKYPFELDKDSFELKLYNLTAKDECIKFFEAIKSFTIQERDRKWIDRMVIRGVTSENYLVFFGTIDNPESYNGYYTYRVDWYYITDEDSEMANEVRFYSREINYFYDPTRSFEKNVTYKNDEILTLQSVNVHSVDSEALQGGSYIENTIQVDVTCKSNFILHYESTFPVESESYLNLHFSEAINIETLVYNARIVNNFLKYICYRNNISFSNISVYTASSGGKQRNCGILIFRYQNDEDKNEKSRNRIIRAEYLNEHIADIIQAIINNEIRLDHCCDSLGDLFNYSIDRVIMILSAFEREYRNIYGQDAIRSEEYKIIKQGVIQSIEKYAENLRGKNKKYAKSLAKRIKDQDASYGDNVKFAFEDCQEIMDVFIKRCFDGSYEDIVEGISESVNNLRNGIAHSRLDMEIEPRHLTDIKLIEEMLYVIRLKKLSIEVPVIQKAINELFGIGAIL